MRKVLLNFAVLAALLFPGFVMTASVDAATYAPICNTADGQKTTVCQDVNAQGGNNDPIIKILKAAVEVVSYVTGVAAIILIIVSAIRFIASDGDSGKVAQAKSTLIYALVGVIITVMAQAIIGFVLNKV